MAENFLVPDNAAAKVEGISYGQWTAKHRFGKDPRDPSELKRSAGDSPDQKMCAICGCPIPKWSKLIKYCSADCQHRGRLKRQVKYARRRNNSGE